MKAVVMTEPGGPEVLALRDVADPVITDPHQCLVRIHAAGVNPVDTKLRGRGTFHPERMPAILGCDGAGVVEAVGDAVTRFRPGDAVLFNNGGIGADQGNYAELTVVHEDYLAAKPEALDFETAAALPLVAITAWESLFDCAHLMADQSVLVHAGAGGVGHVAVQLARIAGARVATTVGSEANAEWVRGLGAELPILYREQDFVAAVQEWAQREGTDVTLDTVGGATFERSFAATAIYGDLVTLLSPGADVSWNEARTRNLRISLELMLTPHSHGLDAARRHQREILEQCAAHAAEGRLQVHVEETFPLAEAAAAHNRIATGGMRGKLVLVP